MWSVRTTTTAYERVINSTRRRAHGNRGQQTDTTDETRGERATTSSLRVTYRSASIIGLMMHTAANFTTTTGMQYNQQVEEDK